MKTLIYSMSLNGELSTTLASLRIISYTHKDDVFDELIMPKNGVLTEEMLAQFRDVDLVMLASSLYHFTISSQAMDSLEIVGDYLRRNNPNVAVTLFTTSAFVLDNIPHELARKWANRFGLRYIKGQSILSMDMLKEKYRADVYAWYINVKALVTAKDLRFNRPVSRARRLYG